MIIFPCNNNTRTFYFEIGSGLDAFNFYSLLKFIFISFHQLESATHTHTQRERESQPASQIDILAADSLLRYLQHPGTQNVM